MPTLNPDYESSRFAEGVRKQTLKPKEWVVIREPPGERWGQPWARNEGLGRITADIVAFTDDDCQPDPDWLENLVKPFEDPAVVGVEGHVYSDAVVPPGHYYPAITRARNFRYRTANMAYRADLLRKLGGFDRRYGFYWREDTDMAWRVLEHGRIVYEPRARVYHPPIPVKGKIAWENDALLAHKFPDRYVELVAGLYNRRDVASGNFFRHARLLRKGARKHGVRVDVGRLYAKGFLIALNWNLYRLTGLGLFDRVPARYGLSERGR